MVEGLTGVDSDWWLLLHKYAQLMHHRTSTCMQMSVMQRNGHPTRPAKPVGVRWYSLRFIAHHYYVLKTMKITNFRGFLLFRCCF